MLPIARFATAKLRLLAIICLIAFGIPDLATAENLCEATKPGPGYKVDGGTLFITSEMYGLADDVSERIQEFFGPGARLVDWVELKRLLASKNDAAKFVDSVGISRQTTNGPCNNFLVTVDGRLRFGNEYRTFVARHDGRVPENWLVLDTIENHTVDLGRWSYSAQALVFVPTNGSQTKEHGQRGYELAIDENLGSIGEWHLGYTRSMGSCFAFATYEDKTTLWFGYLTQQKIFYLVLSNPSWESWFQNGREYFLQLNTSRGGRWRLKSLGMTAGGSKGLISAGLPDNFLNDLAASQGIEVTLRNRVIGRLKLEDVSGAVAASRECQRLRVAAAGRIQQDNDKPTSGSGTGFWVSGAGHVLTNNHVVKDCNRLTIEGPGNISLEARLLGTDAQNDLGLLATGATPKEHAVLRKDIKLGETVEVFGFPLSGILSTGGNFTSGLVSGLTGLRDNTGQFQITAQVQPGNSGGPVLDRYGNVVGIVVSMLDSAKMLAAADVIPQNVNFAIRSGAAANFLDANDIEMDGEVQSVALESDVLAQRAKALAVKVFCRR